MSFPARLWKVGAGLALALCLLAPSAGPAALAQVATATPTPLPKGAFFPEVVVGDPSGPTPVAGGINAQAISIDGTPVVVSGSTPTVTPAPTETPQPTETPRATDTPIPAPTLVATGTPVTSFSLTGRGEYAQGAAVTAANNLTLGTDGNYFEVAGATQINLLCNTNWQGGSHVVLYFQSSPLVKNNQVASGCFKPINLLGAADLQAGTGFTLNLFYDSTNAAWYQVNIQATVTPIPTSTPRATATPQINGVVTTATPAAGTVLYFPGAQATPGVYVTPNAGCAGYPCGAGLATASNILGADVPLNNSANYFDAASMAQGTTGTWWASTTVTVVDTTTAADFACKLWDGTTVASSSEVHTAGANQYRTLTLAGAITSPAANIRISCKDPDTTTGVIKFNVSGNSKDSSIYGVRIA